MKITTGISLSLLAMIAIIPEFIIYLVLMFSLGHPQYLVELFAIVILMTIMIVIFAPVYAVIFKLYNYVKKKGDEKK